MDKHKSMLLNVISNESCDVKSFILVEEVTLFLFAKQCLAPNEAVVIRCCIQIALFLTWCLIRIATGLMKCGSWR